MYNIDFFLSTATIGDNKKLMAIKHFFSENRSARICCTTFFCLIQSFFKANIATSHLTQTFLFLSIN